MKPAPTEARTTDRQGITRWGIFQRRIMTNTEMGLGHADGQVAEAILFIGLDLLVGLRFVNHLAGAINFLAIVSILVLMGRSSG